MWTRNRRFKELYQVNCFGILHCKWLNAKSHYIHWTISWSFFPICSSHPAETGRPVGHSPFWSSCCVHCCSPAGCLPQHASCPLDHGGDRKEQQRQQRHSNASLTVSQWRGNERTHRHLETGTLPRPRSLWPGARQGEIFMLWTFLSLFYLLEFKCQEVKWLPTSVGAGLLDSSVCGWASDISDSFSSSSSWMGEDGDLRVLEGGTQWDINENTKTQRNFIFMTFEEISLRSIWDIAFTQVKIMTLTFELWWSAPKFSSKVNVLPSSYDRDTEFKD